MQNAEHGNGLRTKTPHSARTDQSQTLNLFLICGFSGKMSR